jgi:hypothetical protein
MCSDPKCGGCTDCDAEYILANPGKTASELWVFPTTTPAKFDIGQLVHCFRSGPGHSSFDFVGIVISRQDVGDEADGISWWEYAVTNAPYVLAHYPVLIWEHEMEAL